MKTADQLECMFFEELQTYNITNFNTLVNSDVDQNDAKIRKCYSSVITRYFIFREKHSELSESELNILYFKLKLDMIAQYFATYPDSDVTVLKAFQNELRSYLKLEPQFDDDPTSSEPDESSGNEVTQEKAEVIKDEQKAAKV